MAAYLPPTEDITSFNSALFTHDTGTGLSQTEANKLYLSKKNSDISTAPLTTFNGQVTIGGTTTITDGQTLNARQINSTSTASPTHQLFTNMTTGGVLTIGNSASSNTINGTTTLNNLVNLVNNSNCQATFSADNIAVRVAGGNKVLWTNATAVATLKIGNVLAPITIDASTINIVGATTFSSGVICNNGLTASGITAGGFDTSLPLNVTTICNSTTTGTIRIGASLTGSGTIEFGSQTGINTIKGSSTFNNSATFANSGTTTFNGVNTFNGNAEFPARMVVRGGQYPNEVFTISGVSYTFASVPIHQRIMITQPAAATPVNITLPTISSSTNAGLEFTFIKTGSIANSVVFTAGGTNQIHTLTTITNASPYTTMVNTQTTKVFLILEVSAGLFVWKEIG